MFQRIVVGTDGSESATNALKEAARLAALCSAELHVVSGYHPKGALSVTGAGSSVEPWMVDSEYQVEGILRDAADLSDRLGDAVPAEAGLFDPGDANRVVYRAGPVSVVLAASDDGTSVTGQYTVACGAGGQ